MAGDANDESRFSLRRWSQRKLATQRGAGAEEIARVDVGDTSRFATPVPAGGQVFVGTLTGVVAVRGAP